MPLPKTTAQHWIRHAEQLDAARDVLPDSSAILRAILLARADAAEAAAAILSSNAAILTATTAILRH